MNWFIFFGVLNISAAILNKISQAGHDIDAEDKFVVALGMIVACACMARGVGK